MASCLICSDTDLNNFDELKLSHLLNPLSFIFSLNKTLSFLEIQEIKESDYCSNCYNIFLRIDPVISEYKKLQVQINNCRIQIKHLLKEKKLKVNNSETHSRNIELREKLCKGLLHHCGCIIEDTNISQLSHEGFQVKIELDEQLPNIDDNSSEKDNFDYEELHHSENEFDTIDDERDEDFIPAKSSRFPSNLRKTRFSNKLKTSQSELSSQIETLNQEENSSLLSNPNSSSDKSNQEDNDEEDNFISKPRRYKKPRMNSTNNSPMVNLSKEVKKFLKLESLNKSAYIPLKRVDQFSPEEIRNLITSKKSIKYRRSSVFHFKCEYPNCSYSTKTQMNLDAHVNSKHKGIERPFVCLLCEKGFLSARPLEDHIEIAHGTNIFKCDECSKEFKLKRHLETHKNKVHRENKKKPRSQLPRKLCTICGKTVLDLSTHVNRQHQNFDEDFACDQCDIAFNHPLKLKKHKRHVHPTGTGNDFNCSKCDMTFVNEFKLKRHDRDVHAPKTIPCPYCPKLFSHQTALTLHQRNHQEERKFPCEFEGCGLKCRSADRLKDHMRSHTGERPFKCTLCPMAFALNNTLKQHMKTAHSEEKPFLCPICGIRLKRKDLLTFHIGGVHEGKYKKNKLPMKRRIKMSDFIDKQGNPVQLKTPNPNNSVT